MLPLAAILLVLGVAAIHDLLLPSLSHVDDEEERPEPKMVDPHPLIALRFNDVPYTGKEKYVSQTMSFGLSVLDRKGRGGDKRLMFEDRGMTNNTCLRIDGRDYLFGHDHIVFPNPDAEPKKVPDVGRWIEMRGSLRSDRAVGGSGQPRDGARSVWQVLGIPEHFCRIQVTQTVEIIRGNQSGMLDTCMIRWTIQNLDVEARQVGLRFLLDTFIGDNDGVPFTIPGKPGLCSTRLSFDRPSEVPDYIEALENDDLRAPEPWRICSSAFPDRSRAQRACS